MATWSASGITWATYAFAGGNQTDQNAQLLNTYLGNSGGTQSVTISGIPFSTYNVYAYFTTAGSGNTGGVTTGGKADYYYQTLGPITTTPYPLLRTTDTTYDSTGVSYPLTNYALFTGLSGATRTITLATQSFGDSGFAAVEVVGLLGPSGSLSVANAVQLTANSTIDVSGLSSGTLGNFLAASSNTFFLTGSGTAANSAYSLTLGSGSLAGNPTFDVANNGSGLGTLLLGALGDGGTARTITKANAGALTLAAAAASLVQETAVNVSGGTLNSNNATALGTFAQVTVASGATFNLGAGQQISSLGGSGSVILGGNRLTIGNSDNVSNTFSGSISGVGGISKTGAGTLSLTGSNIYTGPTTVNQGKLVVDGWLTSSAVSVNSGGTLGGTGNLTSVTVNAGGNLAPGDSLGTLSASGGLILSGGAVMDYELDTPSTSSMISAGSLTLNGQQFSDFNFTWSGNFGRGIYPLIAFGSTSGSLGAITSGTIDGFPATLAVQGNDLVVNVVPEPSTAALLAVGVAGLIGRVWRRRFRNSKSTY